MIKILRSKNASFSFSMRSNCTHTTLHTDTDTRRMHQMYCSWHRTVASTEHSEKGNEAQNYTKLNLN